MSLKVAILGGTSHIAGSLVPHLIAKGAAITLFARSPEKLLPSPCKVVGGFDALMAERFDLLINCIGAGNPKELASDYNRWFSVLEKFDNLSLDYLKNVNSSALYVTFSSGAVYGRKGDAPSTEESSWQLFPNRINVPDYYALSKIYSEAKHRSLPHLRIADLRIFSFFSRSIDLDSGYFMTDLVKALIANECFETPSQELIRDYPHPADLTELILTCSRQEQINQAIDVASSKPVSKQEILDSFAAEFKLKYRFTDSSAPHSPNGNANIYLPTGTMAEKRLNWKAHYSSLETLISETKAIMGYYKNA